MLPPLFDQLIKLWPIAVVVLNAAGLIGMALLRSLMKTEIAASKTSLEARDKELAALIDVHDTRLTVAEGAITEIRNDIRDLPTKEDLARVEGAVKAVEREVTATGAGVSRLESFFLKRGVEGVG